MVLYYCMSQDQTMKDILETVQFLKENAATSAEVGEVRAEVHQLRKDGTKEIISVKTEVITHVDGLAVLHQRLDTELAALRMKYERLQGHVLQLARHAQIELEM